jgi:hypothetical protein
MVIPGVDEPKVILEPYRPTEHFVIGHFGSLSGSRNLEMTMAAIEMLVQARPESRSAIALHVYGGPLDTISSKAIKSSGCKDCVTHFGRIEHDLKTGKSGRDQILQRMRSADVLLLLHGQDPICSEYIPSKLYEYLWMQRPVVALVNNNAQMTAILLQANQHVVETGSQSKSINDATTKLALAYGDLYTRWRSAGLPDNGYFSRYSTENSVMQILAWTTAVVGRP